MEVVTFNNSHEVSDLIRIHNRVTFLYKNIITQKNIKCFNNRNIDVLIINIFKKIKKVYNENVIEVTHNRRS